MALSTKVDYLIFNQGDQMFLLKNHPKTMKNRPKSCPTIFLLDLLYKTVLWCFLFDFMLISNGTGHSFFYIKKEINFLNIFEKHVKKLFWTKILALLRSILGYFLWLKFHPNHWATFSRKKFAQHHKKLPKLWNFAQSGHPVFNSLFIKKWTSEICP